MTAPVQVGPSSSSGGPVPSLTERELDLLRRQASGQKQREIAPDLFMTASGVDSLSRRIVKRLGARNLAHAIHIAHQNRLLDPPAGVELPGPLVEVLELVADGCTNAEVAHRLRRSQHTVADQVREARRRLGARDRAHAAVLAVEQGLIRRPGRQANRTS